MPMLFEEILFDLELKRAAAFDRSGSPGGSTDIPSDLAELRVLLDRLPDLVLVHRRAVSRTHAANRVGAPPEGRPHLGQPVTWHLPREVGDTPTSTSC